jgi:hypothetical protein
MSDGLSREVASSVYRNLLVIGLVMVVGFPVVFAGFGLASLDRGALAHAADLARGIEAAAGDDAEWRAVAGARMREAGPALLARGVVAIRLTDRSGDVVGALETTTSPRVRAWLTGAGTASVGDLGTVEVVLGPGPLASQALAVVVASWAVAVGAALLMHLAPLRLLRVAETRVQGAAAATARPS